MAKKDLKKQQKQANRSKVDTKTTYSKESMVSKYLLLTQDYKMIAAALLITAAVFWNTQYNEFVNWDDDRNFLENPLITTLNAENFWSNTVQIFKTPVIGNYNPLTIWSFLIDMKLFGLENPGGWHLMNVLYHLIAVVFVYLIGRRLNLNWMAAGFFTLLFAIHPLRVESVTWVTERKDVLFGSFFLIALWQYIRSKQDDNRKAVKWIYLFFILSLLSKIQAVALPLVMLVVDYYLDDKFSWKNVIQKFPYFILSLIIGLVGIYFLKDEGSINATATTYASWQRIFIGSYSYCVYLVKSIIPYRMSPLYPYPNVIPVRFYVSILIAPMLLYGLYYAYKRNLKVWVFGFLFFTFNIVFLLQILGAGQGFLADRFTYIAHLGLYFILAYYFQKSIEFDKWKIVIKGLAMGMIGIFSVMTALQNQVWKNSGTLWTHVLKYQTNVKTPYGNRANYYRDNGQLDKAMSDYNSAIELGIAHGKNEELAQTYNSRARLYFDGSNNPDTIRLAIADYTKAIELKPNDGEFYTNRGASYARIGQIDQALADITKGIEVKPDHAVAYLNRSLMYNMKQRPDLALADLEKYLTLKPYNADIWYEKGRLQQQGNALDLAISSFDRAIELNAGKAIYYYGRSQAFYAKRNINAAINDLKYAESLGFKNVDPQYKRNLGM